RLLEVNRAGVRLDLVNTAGLHENNVALGKGQVELAVIRLDDPPPTEASLVAILRTNVVIAVAPARHKLENFSDLKGKRLGLVPPSSLEEASFRNLVGAFGLKPADIKMTVIKAEDVAKLTAGNRIDCVVIFGVPADPEVAAVVYAVDARKKEPPTILGVDIGD